MPPRFVTERLTKQTKPRFFSTPAEFRAWLKKHHTTKDQLLVGFHKRATGTPCMTWPESVSAALVFGWIDGVRKSLGNASYTIRFSKRRRGSIWSRINIKTAETLIAQGEMSPAGLAAFQVRKEYRSGVYSYEQRRADLEPPYDTLLRKNKKAWDFYRAQPPSYKKVANWWISSAKREETRLKRLAKLKMHSARGERVPQFMSSKPSP